MVQAGQPPADPNDPNATPAGEASGPAPNLKWEKFPAEYADYYTTQRMLANPTDPQPFCKSQKPLRIESQLSYGMNAILDESGGTGTGYDTLYIDTSGAGDFSEMETHKLGQTDRKTGLEGHPLVSYFESVPVERHRSAEGTIHVQMYVEQNPDRIEGSEYLLNLIPEKWAVGTVQINGQPTPIAMVDGNFDESATTRGGARPGWANQAAPGDDFAVVRGDYLIVGKPGETSLQPGDPNGWLGKTGSMRALNTQYLVTDAGMFELQADQNEQGVNLQMVPAVGVPTSTVDLSYLPSTTGRVAMYGTNACVILDNHGSCVEVPGDTYYVPMFGSYTLDAPAQGRAVLTPPPGIDAANVHDYDPLADRDQMIYSAEPPGGELGTTNAIRWSQARNHPFSFVNPGQAGGSALEIYAVAENGAWVAGAPFTVYSFSNNGACRGMSGTRRVVTNSSGRCTIPLPADPENVYAICEAKGYVPAAMFWTKQAGREIPTQFTWLLEKGTPIGGTVRDEKGRPISGVQVELFAASNTAQGGTPFPMLQQLQIHTDSRGKWKCDTAPSNLSQVMIGLSHPTHISDDFPNRQVKIEELRNLTCELVMKQGVTLAGKVVDRTNKPIVGAIVNYGNFTPAKTDKKGQYRIRNLAPGRLNVTARANGMAPEMQTVKIEEEMKPVDFKLGPGNLIRGRVVDQDNRPVPQAQVNLVSWRGTRNIFWNTNTDSEGRWTWKEAPADEAVFSVTAKDFMPIDRIQIAPQRFEQIITLRSHLTVSGRVTDAATGQPISSFTVTPGVTVNVPGIYRWLGEAAATGTNGAFSLQVAQPSSQYRVRLEAPGYYSTMSKAFTGANGDVALDVSLRAED